MVDFRASRNTIQIQNLVKIVLAKVLGTHDATPVRILVSKLPSSFCHEGLVKARNFLIPNPPLLFQVADIVPAVQYQPLLFFHTRPKEGSLNSFQLLSH